ELLPRINRLSKQYFWGGDQSGAALHYHVSAFNALFIGEKATAGVGCLGRGEKAGGKAMGVSLDLPKQR
ncbi:Uncharacterized protein SCF082_LOCUS23189, partial [Durusdinium trenchii]